MITSENKIKTIILLGLFDVNSFDKYFFSANNIIDLSKLNEASVFSGIGGAQIITDEVRITVSTNQIAIADETDNMTSNLAKYAEEIIKHGGIAHLRAMGINFHWMMSDTTKTKHELSKEFFYNDLPLVKKHFNSRDSLYGLYISKDYLNSRMKLDIKPQLLSSKTKDVKIDGIGFAFNYHFELSSNEPKTEAIDRLQDYLNYENYSKELVLMY